MQSVALSTTLELLRRGDDFVLARNPRPGKVTARGKEDPMAREWQLLTVGFVFAFLGAIVVGFL